MSLESQVTDDERVVEPKPKRTDYPFNSRDLINFHECPSEELIKYLEVMRRWRDESSRSNHIYF